MPTASRRTSPLDERLRPGASGWRPALLLLLLLGVSSVPLAHAGGRQADSDYLKASFVYRLAHFIKWPDERAAKPQMDFCVLARPAMVDALRGALQERRLGEREPRVVKPGEDESLSSCDVLYVGSAMIEVFAARRSSIGRAPVLVVGEHEGFVGRGAMINLVARDRKLRFEIDQEALRQARLRPASQLLRLALGSRGGGP